LRILKFEGIDTRLIEGYAVPAACYAAAMGEQNVGPASEVLGNMLKTVEVMDDSDDAMQLLQDIWESEVMGDKGFRSTVSQIIESKAIEPARLSDLHRVGIGLVEHLNQKDWLFVAHKQACRYLLRSTEWEKQNIDEILRRVDGAEKVKKKIGGRRPWGVVIPPSVLESL
jgi:hypothetical protein